MARTVVEKVDGLMQVINKTFCVRDSKAQLSAGAEILMSAAVRAIILEQDRDTRHACAEAVLDVTSSANPVAMSDDPLAMANSASRACLNARAT